MTLLSTPLHDRMGKSMDDTLDTLRILSLTFAISLAVSIQLSGSAATGGPMLDHHSVNAPMSAPSAIEVRALI
ncbi:hypothetical protein [Phaeobacter porticola]|uniref:Uncharacterized protein n=1 Tax=Phaeobacter porticola TaxID=1844006 RepID=A0A1L3I2I9_9RHOB|nr:hypothetical protein [Phaeobacter porticola]APG46334.1 hypothetical protein PhaeoP97_00907 [Phaeobacter porticola]